MTSGSSFQDILEREAARWRRDGRRRERDARIDLQDLATSLNVQLRSTPVRPDLKKLDKVNQGEIDLANQILQKRSLESSNVPSPTRKRPKTHHNRDSDLGVQADRELKKCFLIGGSYIDCKGLSG